MEKITIELSDRNARLLKYFLGSRYGEAKGLKKLVTLAAFEIMATQAGEELEEAEQELENV